MFEKTKAQCDSFLGMGVPGFDFLVYRDGKEFFRYMGGYSDLENRIPIRGDERRRLYSCTKPMTVTAAMQLWEQGKFSLEDSLSDYLPAYKEMTVQTETGLRKAEQPILIRHLFTMTAGFSYNYHSPALEALRQQNPAPSTRQVIDALAQDPLLFEPGDRYNYSLCHDVLGALIEELSGQSLEDYMKTHVFDPLGMTQTTYRLSEAEHSTLSPLYTFDKENSIVQREPLTFRVGPNFVSGGGGSVSTTEDYMRFAEAMREGERLLKRSTIDMMTKSWLTERQKRTFRLTTVDYGLGMWCPKTGELRQDFGWGGAAAALLAVDPGRGLSMVYMQHLLHSPNQALRGKLIKTFLAELEDLGDGAAETVLQDNNLTY